MNLFGVKNKLQLRRSGRKIKKPQRLEPEEPISKKRNLAKAKQSLVSTQMINTSDIPTGSFNIRYIDFSGLNPNLVVDTNFNLSSHLEKKGFEGFIAPPGGTSDFRGMFSDLNKILLSDQIFRYSNTLDNGNTTLAVTTTINCNNKNARKSREPSQNWYNMCFYCGKVKGVNNLECDHVIPIMQMFVSVIPNKNIYYNFELVHKECNNKAKKMPLSEIWNKIGTGDFPGPASLPYATVFYNNKGIAQVSSTDKHTREWCRGYLAMQILNKLSFFDLTIQRVRTQQLEQVTNKYTAFKESVEKQYLTDIGEGAIGLLNIFKKTIDKKSKFGKIKQIELIKIKKLKNDDKKYEATFKIDGKQKTTKFGAEGMSDFTIHKDVKRRERYINRHKSDLRTNDPSRAGYLSMYVLWNKPSLKASIYDYTKRLKIYNKTGIFNKSISGSKILNFGTPISNIPFSETSMKNLPDEIQNKIEKEVFKKNMEDNMDKMMLKNFLINIKNKSNNRTSLDRILNITSIDTVVWLKLANKILQKKDFTINSLWTKIIIILLEELDFLRPFDNPVINVRDMNIIIKVVDNLENLIESNFNIKFDFDREDGRWAETAIVEIKTEITSKNSFGNKDLSTIPVNVKNKKLYLSIKNKIKKEIGTTRRWGAYDSGRLVREYKKKGGEYLKISEDNSGKLSRWYKEKWIDACKWPNISPCGREENDRQVTYCRPLIRVTKDTPKTIKELSAAKIKERCKRKSINPIKIIR
jgi:hypothetical protein